MLVNIYFCIFSIFTHPTSSTVEFSICYVLLAICPLQFVIRYMLLAICYFLYVTCFLRPSVWNFLLLSKLVSFRSLLYVSQFFDICVVNIIQKK